jgi:hypothetical protein
MKKYLTTLIEEKGGDLDHEITIDGHYGLTYRVLIDFIEQAAPETRQKIRKTLVMIDFKNGDVFHYLDYLAHGMAQAYDNANDITRR